MRGKATITANKIGTREQILFGMILLPAIVSLKPYSKDRVPASLWDNS
jgi:hypothetical protein